MNILFYVEPHPIRNNLVEFYWVAEKILKMLDDEYNQKIHSVSSSNVKLLCSRYIHSESSKLLKDININEFILGLTKEENDFIINTYYKDWDEKQLSIWEDLLSGKGNVSKYYESILKRVYQSYKFDVIVYWGTNGAVRNFSANYNIPAIAMELGCTRKPFFESAYFDFLGVNGRAYVNKIILNTFETAYTIDELQTIVPIKQFQEKSIDAKFDVLEHEMSDLIYQSASKNILIPLQLMDDTNIILYSQYTTMLDFLQDIIPDLIAHGYSCYIKPHPGNVVRKINQDDHNKCKQYCANIKNTYWIENFDNNKSLLSLYTKMDFFIVINSSVGFEAMMLNKIVISMGKSPYNISENLPTVKDLLNHDINLLQYKSTITKIVNLLLFHYLHIKDKAFEFNYFLNAIEFNRELFYLYKEDKAQFESSVISNKINSIYTFLDYPSKRHVKHKSKILNSISRVTDNEALFNVHLKQKIKSLPLIGKLALQLHNIIKAYK